MSYYLRELSKEDLDCVNKWRNDPVIIANLGAPFRFVNKEVDEVWLDAYTKSRANNVRLSIIDKSTDLPVGAVYLLGIDWVSRSGEFAIWIGEIEAQGKGCGSFASKAMLNHAFNDLNLNRVFLTVLPDNKKALNLYERIGFQLEGRPRQAVFKNGKFSDLIQMSILAEEFDKIRVACSPKTE